MRPAFPLLAGWLSIQALAAQTPAPTIDEILARVQTNTGQFESVLPDFVCDGKVVSLKILRNLLTREGSAESHFTGLQKKSGKMNFTESREFVTINGKPANLADYIIAKGIDTEFPLVGDYCGCPVNVSIQNVDPVTHCVDLYAPVFPGVDYRFAEPVKDYARAFAKVAGTDHAEPDFACNCILNFLYGKLEGKKTGNVTGPITFGEIAHQLLNQTLVRMYLRDV